MSDRLSEIEGRLAAATPGPWEAVDYEVLATEIDIADCQTLPDADLIAHAPSDLAALVKFAREIEARHRPVHPDWVRPGDRVCEECTDAAAYAAGVSFIAWPCPTAAAVQRLGGA